MTSMHFPTSVIFVNDGRHVTLSGAKSPKVWVTLAMSGTDLEDFDLFATPIHEYNIKGEQELDSVTVPLRFSSSRLLDADMPCVVSSRGS